MSANPDTPAAAFEEPRPRPLLAGLFVGFASASACMGLFWIFAAVFPALVAGIASLLPIEGHWHFARGAAFAVLGVATFEAVFAALIWLT